MESLLSKGHKYDFKSNVLSKLDNIVFFSEMPKDGSSYIKILGLDGSKRTEKWIRKDYVRVPENFGSYKVLSPKQTVVVLLAKLSQHR